MKHPPQILATLLLAALTASANAHTWLSPDSVDDAIERMRELRAESTERFEAVDKAVSLYGLGKTAADLAALMNEEFAAHGPEQRELLVSATERAAEIDVEILWSEDHRRFFYDGDEFLRYLALSPDGAHAAEARFYLIETDFYLARTDDRESLQRRIAEKHLFLDRFPDFREHARVSLFLGIDFRDLWRLCMLQNDAECASKNAELAAQQFRRVADDGAGSEVGEIGRRLLHRLQQEIESTAQ